MVRANVGAATGANPKAAGLEAANKAKAGLTSPKMAYVYASCAYDLDELLAGVREGLPGVPLIGNTSFTGVITPDGFVGGDDGFVGVLAVEDDDMTVGVAYAERGECPVATGEEAARKAMEKAGKDTAPDYFYMVAPPGEEEFFLKGISKVIGRVPFFGGSAADNAIAGEWKLYTDEKVFANGVAVCFFYSDKPMVNKFTGAYRETSDMGLITKVDGHRTLVEIDGMPAVQKYAEWRRMKPEEFAGGNLLVQTITSPLGVKDRLGDLVAIRHPMNGNEDGSMAIGNNLAVGTAVIRMEASVDELIDSTGKTLTELKGELAHPAYYHLVHCGGRRAGIGDRIDEVAKQMKEAAGGVPFITEFTFGEYGFEDDGRNTCGGLMLSFTGVEE